MAEIIEAIRITLAITGGFALFITLVIGWAFVTS